jgi:hypothetical protein
MQRSPPYYCSHTAATCGVIAYQPLSQTERSFLPRIFGVFLRHCLYVLFTLEILNVVSVPVIEGAVLGSMGTPAPSLRIHEHFSCGMASHTKIVVGATTREYTAAQLVRLPDHLLCQRQLSLISM